ncbi:hypothetical protein [Thermotomaculum hydrothermale]|uniref:hypothetical protein n=1 Tax=Thermotomaculum hydrothermale TaxID=981385 RepID=UPI001915E93A|nr:hypothetical protein [Thermotomaculum hydrothermale]
MKGDIMKGIKNYFVISFLIGLVIIIFSLGLNMEIFRSAMIFGLVSGITICLLSLTELYKSYYFKSCPICGDKIEFPKNKCSNCGYELKTKRIR